MSRVVRVKGRSLASKIGKSSQRKVNFAIFSEYFRSPFEELSGGLLTTHCSLLLRLLSRCRLDLAVISCLWRFDAAENAPTIAQSLSFRSAEGKFESGE
jgi:hypothetical protein